MLQQPIVAAERHPTDLAALRHIVDRETDGDYRSFRRSLVPRFARVRRDLALGYCALAVTLLLAALATTPLAGLGVAAVAAVSVGYWIAYLQLFIHEAAHYNLASDRGANDRLADGLICWQVGTSIAAYRRTHAEHHRSLGGPKDTETSYRHRLTPAFLLEMVTGIHAARIFLARRRAPQPSRPAPERASPAPLLKGVAAHLAIVAGLLALGAWPAALAWIGGVGVFFPLFATVRQLLEHRPAQASLGLASGDGDGAVTRLFGDGAFARTFGGAGFNRHLLHHIEPQISYTRLQELESYLMTTSAATALDARRSSYGRTFVELLRDGLRG